MTLLRTSAAASAEKIGRKARELTICCMDICCCIGCEKIGSRALLCQPGRYLEVNSLFV